MRQIDIERASIVAPLSPHQHESLSEKMERRPRPENKAQRERDKINSPLEQADFMVLVEMEKNSLARPQLQKKNDTLMGRDMNNFFNTISKNATRLTTTRHIYTNIYEYTTFSNLRDYPTW